MNKTKTDIVLECPEVSLNLLETKLRDIEMEAMLIFKFKVYKKLDDAMTGFTPKEAKKVMDQVLKELVKRGLVKTYE